MRRGRSFDVWINFRACRVRQKLRAQGDAQRGAVGRDHALKCRHFLGQKGISLRPHILHPHRATEQDKHSKLIQVGWYLIASIKMADLGGNPKVAQNWHNAARTSVRNMLKDDGAAHVRE